MTQSASNNTDSKPRVLLLSGYDAASHRRWREQLVALFPDYHWYTLALSPRYFRWRIRGNPLAWLNEPCFRESWDLVIATSMVDLAALKGFHPALAGVPCLLYMHENQFAFPVSDRQHSSVDPQVVNLYSAIAADGLMFNSAWNRDSFLDGATRFLDRMPDGVPYGLIAGLRDKARVLPVPIEDRMFVSRETKPDWQCPHLLWNHRWEYDKGPGRLLGLLNELERREVPYRVSVVGESFRKYPPEFDDIRKRFAHRINHWGFLEQRADYDRLLAEADIVLSTALHDFQGLSMLEAMASGCVALAPDRLAYREYVPAENRYASQESAPEHEARAAADTLAQLMDRQPAPVYPGDWQASVVAGQYRDLFEAAMAGAGRFS